MVTTTRAEKHGLKKIQQISAGLADLRKMSPVKCPSVADGLPDLPEKDDFFYLNKSARVLHSSHWNTKDVDKL